MIEIPRFELHETAPLFSLLGAPVASPRPLGFEQIGQDYGFLLYRTRASAVSAATLEIAEPRDFAVVLEGGRRLATIDRRLGETRATISLSGKQPLDILVENMGRVNFGPKLLEDRKGITEKVTSTAPNSAAGRCSRSPCDDLRGLRFSKAAPRGPSFFRGYFTLERTGDTFVDTRGWGQRGNVWVNGRNLGRYWKIGPQQTLYCPGAWAAERPQRDHRPRPVRRFAGALDRGPRGPRLGDSRLTLTGRARSGNRPLPAARCRRASR